MREGPASRILPGRGIALQRPDVKERLSALGYDSKPNTPEEFSAFVAGEIQKWGKVVKASGAKAD